MSLLSKLRRMFFPTMAEMAENVTNTAAGIAANMQTAMDAQMRARGLKPCTWCRQYTDGATGGTKAYSRGMAIFCSGQCRHAFDGAMATKPVTCSYCSDVYPSGLNECPGCGASRTAAK
jgi:hypothetical protein